MRARLLLCTALLAGVAALPARAQDATQGAQGGLLCTYAGHDYKVGEFACIAACHGRRRLARCDAAPTSPTATGSTATASWTYVSDACPSASLNPPWPSDWSELPVAADMTPMPLTVNMSAIDPSLAPAVAAARLPKSFIR